VRTNRAEIIGRRTPTTPVDRVKVFDASVAFRTAETKPDYVLISPWNLRKKITSQLAYIRSRDARFIVPIPEVSVI